MARIKTAPLTADEKDLIRLEHVIDEDPLAPLNRRCRECFEPWPCMTIRLVDEIILISVQRSPDFRHRPCRCVDCNPKTAASQRDGIDYDSAEQ